jgi:hypothetical protein
MRRKTVALLGVTPTARKEKDGQGMVRCCEMGMRLESRGSTKRPAAASRGEGGDLTGAMRDRPGDVAEEEGGLLLLLSLS